MKHIAFIRIIILIAVAGYPLTNFAKSRSNQREGIEIRGVIARFDIKNHVIHRGDPLIVQLRLRNITKTSVSFSFLPAFVLHTRVYDTRHNEVSQRSDAPILEPVRRDLPIGPGEQITIENTLDLPLYYDLQRGGYYLKFFYDLRLIDNREVFEQYRKRYHSSDYVPWNSRFYPFTIK